MHLFQSLKIRHAIAFGIGAAIGVLYVLSAIAANADTVTGVSMAGNGQTMVKGARVTAVSGDIISATSEWGAAKIQWKIQVLGKTRFSPAREHEKLSEDIRVGETIGFSGMLDQKSTTPLIYASSVRDETVMQMASVLTGNVVDTGSDVFTVQTDTGTSTVRVSTGTIMTKDGNRAGPLDLFPGEEVKAFGTFNSRLRILEAERIVAVSAMLPKIPNTGTPEQAQKKTVFESIVAWLNLHRGALSVR